MTLARAGDRTSRIVFERATTVDDDYGQKTPTWATWAAAYASLRWGTSAERRQAASEQGSQAATFRVLATAKTKAVTVRDRIVFDGTNWDIEGIAPIGRTEIEFTATRAT